GYRSLRRCSRRAARTGLWKALRYRRGRTVRRRASEGPVAGHRPNDQLSESPDRCGPPAKRGCRADVRMVRPRRLRCRHRRVAQGVSGGALAQFRRLGVRVRLERSRAHISLDLILSRLIGRLLETLVLITFTPGVTLWLPAQVGMIR